MLIECPFCHSPARIPSDKEGAKVRCGACGKLYTARDPQARGRRSSTRGLSIAIFVGAGLIAAAVFYALNRKQSEPLPLPLAAHSPAPAAQAPADPSGWDAEPVRAARALLEAAFARNEPRLLELLAPGESPGARLARLVGVPDAAGFDREALSEWKPFDGELLAESDERATVRLSLAGRRAESAAETRQYDLDLARVEGEWKVLDWARYRTPEELAQVERAERREQRAAEVQVQARELTDGSLVLEAEPGPIPYPESTSPELRARIQATYERMLDFGLRPRENAAAKAELVEIGAPALPALLTGMHELPLLTDEDAMRVNLVNQCLEEITGVHTGFKPQVQEGSGVGTTAERRASAIRQWFAWWHREGVRFEGRAAPADPEQGRASPPDGA